VSRSPVHYEVFARRTPQSSWVLEMATEDRALALQSAEDWLAARNAAAVRVTKELFDQESGEFSSVTLMTKGVPEGRKKLRLAPETDSVCTTPQDLYSLHARDKVGRLLEDWLRRNGVTPFELLHRPDLAERLDAADGELLHVVQKLAIPESHETGQDLHELMRRWRALIDRATARLIADGRRKLFPDLDPASWMATIDRLKDHPERAYVLGGAIARVLAGEKRPSVKLERLLVYGRLLSDDMFEADWSDREWALQVLEVPVVELFAARAALNDILGHEADLGTSLAVLTRMAAGAEVDLIARHDAKVGAMIPPLAGVLAGYHDLIVKGCFPNLSYNISKRLMHELKGVRRLKPGDPDGEIEILRSLALCLMAAGREEHQRDDIKEAFVERSKMLVSTDFVDALTKAARSPAEEIEKLVWLCENVVGGANKRQAARWLIGAIGALKFERDMRDPSKPPMGRLATLAQLQRRIQRAQLPDRDSDDAVAKLGQLGGLVAADTHLLAQLVKAPTAPLQKLSVLLSLAAGQTGPLGPVADAAKSEALKLLRAPEVRQMLATQPQAVAALKPMIQAAGLAA